MNRETKMKNLPDKIYLNTGSVHCDDFKELSEVTWSENMTNPGDIEYRLAYTEQPKGKTLDGCKDEVAKRHGYEDWFRAAHHINALKLMDEVCELYAQAKAVEPQHGWIGVTPEQELSLLIQLETVRNNTYDLGISGNKIKSWFKSFLRNIHQEGIHLIKTTYVQSKYTTELPWINVNDRLPELNKMALVLIEGKNTDTDYLVNDNGNIRWSIYYYVYVTHWMHLPPAPTTKI